jgi:hypothetical protein
VSTRVLAVRISARGRSGNRPNGRSLLVAVRRICAEEGWDLLAGAAACDSVELVAAPGTAAKPLLTRLTERGFAARTSAVRPLHREGEVEAAIDFVLRKFSARAATWDSGLFC